MTWVRLDDHFDEHPKFARVGPLGMALWTTALAYCNRNNTRGFVPWSVARRLVAWEFPGPPEQDGRRKLYRVTVSCGMVGDDISGEFVVGLLVDAGLWQEVDGGYQIHDYDEYQPSPEQVADLREKRATAGRLGGLAKQANAVASAKQVPKQTPSKTVARSRYPVPVPGKDEDEEVPVSAETGGAAPPQPFTAELRELTDRLKDEDIPKPERLAALVAFFGSVFGKEACGEGRGVYGELGSIVGLAHGDYADVARRIWLMAANPPMGKPLSYLRGQFKPKARDRPAGTNGRAGPQEWPSSPPDVIDRFLTRRQGGAS